MKLYPFAETRVDYGFEANKRSGTDEEDIRSINDEGLPFAAYVSARQ